MSETLQLGEIGQISRNVSDVKASTKWYRDIVGLKHLYSFGDLAFFDCNGTRLFLNQSEPPLTEESILYFRVENIHDTYQFFS